ncbi:MAG: FtsX-like permease family protein [Paraclostridium sp.]|uniref:ABC transporter permease n=1 Tax=Paraclostridium sp. TaxID=2023273 RepID=UPI003F3AFC0D
MRLNDIVKKYIFKNKKNAILIIISIIISTALFLVMNIISEDARNLIIDQSKKELGTKHASYAYPTNENLNFLKNNPNIEKVGTSLLLGIHDIGNGQMLQIIADDKNAQELSESYKLEKGNLPIKENEIAIDSWYIEQKDIQNPIGKTIKLDYKNYNSKGEVVYKGEKDFKITGILKSSHILKAQGTSLGCITEESAKKNIPLENKYDQAIFKFTKEKNIQKQVETLVKDGNLKKDNMNLNNPLILAMSDSLSLKIPYIIVNIILALATILLIYNIFYTLVYSRTKDFGILRAVGFIPTDISKIMVLEVLIYTVISIPIGLLLGGVVVELSRSYVIGAIYDINYVNSIKSNNYLSVYIISASLSILTIAIAVLKPLIMSYKTDPMVCMRRSEEKIKINQNSIITKFMTKYFKDYGNIASKNLQRNKKRTRLAVASMTIIIFLMMTVYTKSTSNFLNNNELRHWIPGDYLMHNIDIYSAMDNQMGYDKSTLEQIRKIDGVKKVEASRVKLLHIDIDINKIDKNSTYWKKSKDHFEQKADIIELREGSKAYRESFEVMGIENIDILDKVLIEGKENIKKLNDEPYIYIDKNSSEKFKLKVGDRVKVNFEIIDVKSNEYKETLSKKFTVGGIMGSIPLTSQGAGAEFGAVMSANQMDKFTGVKSYERFDVWTSKLANDSYVEDKLDKIIDKSDKGILIPYKSEAGKIEKGDNQKTLVMIIVVGVIITLSLFNCCNIIITSINSRTREFALFRGIGISKDEIAKIVKLEGFVYVGMGFVIAIVPSLMVRSIIIKDFTNIHLINLKFILAGILICGMLLAIIMLIIVKTLKQIQKEDFIEQIKTLE